MTDCSISEAISWGTQQLHGIDTSAKLDCEILLASALGRERIYLYTWPERAVGDAWDHFKRLIQRRKSGEPIAYILGEREFWSLTLKVTPATLIPRPETELLVEKVLEYFDPQPLQVLDLGTGSGAIALALASERPKWQITAVDISREAIAVAEENRCRNNITNVSFLAGSWFEPVNTRFDLIVSNPPYVASSSPYLNQGDVRFEPQSALTSGSDGMDDINAITANASSYLVPGGMIVFEHGFDQAEQIAKVLTEKGFINIQSFYDLNHLPRVTMAILVDYS